MQSSSYGSTGESFEGLARPQPLRPAPTLTPPPVFTPLTSDCSLGSDASSEHAGGWLRYKVGSAPLPQDSKPRTGHHGHHAADEFAGSLRYDPGAMSHEHGHYHYSQDLSSGNAQTSSAGSASGSQSDERKSALAPLSSSSNWAGYASGSLNDERKSALAPFSSSVPPGLAAGNSPGEPAFAAEFCGTFVLVFIILSCSTSGNSAWNSAAIGSILAAMCYAMGMVSGAHLNPAVSLSFALLGAVRWRVTLAYWVAQATAGICAGCLHRSLLSVPMAPPAPFEMQLSMLIEAIYTCFLCFVVLSCSVSKRNNPREDRNQIFGLAIGAAFVAGGYATSEISGMALNPAAALGRAFTFDINVLSWCFGAAWQCIGAALATLLFRATHAETFYVNQDADTFEVSPARVRKLLFGRCLSEVFGTFVIVLTAGMVQISETPAAPIAIAAAYVAMLYSVGKGEGHFNPAVTFAAIIRSQIAPGADPARDFIELCKGFLYATCQVLGGILAGLIIAVVHKAGPNQFKTFGLGPGASYNLWTAGWLEFIFTTILAYVVLSSATTTVPQAWKTSQNFYFGIAIGAAVAAAGYACGSVSGAAINPAVSVGIVTASLAHPGALTKHAYINLAVYSSAELFGGVIAALGFRATHTREFFDGSPSP